MLRVFVIASTHLSQSVAFSALKETRDTLIHLRV